MASTPLQSGAADDSRLLLTLTNDREAMDETRLAVLRLLAPHEPTPQLLFNVELILEETLMNVIWHAFTDEAEHTITMSVQVEPDDIVMRFEDDGMAFDPLLAPTPTLPTSIDQAVPGGLGLLLVRKLSRSVGYARTAGRNCLTVRVARH